MKPGTKKLLVEGKDDVHVIGAFLKRRALEHLLPRDQIVALGGDGPLLESIPVQIKAAAELDALGIVIDIDASLSNRWQSLSERLRESGYVEVPREPVPGGWVSDSIAVSKLARLGVWLMPDNRNPGKLEDFVCSLIPAGDSLFARAQTAVAAIPPEERRFSVPDMAKATLHTWLAWQKEPGTPMGRAIAVLERNLSVDGPEADAFANWLQRCFSPVASP